MIQNVIIAGVGGQGSLLASRIIGTVFTLQGYEVKVNEVHGMSQRGGSVVTTVRAGREVYSPLIPDGEVELLIALEHLEGLRWLHTLAPNALAFVNTQEILPMPVLTGAAAYPNDIASRFKSVRSLFLDAVSLAIEAGNPKATNVVLLGAASRCMEAPLALWTKALEQHVKPQFLSVNQKAFTLGRDAANAIV